MAVPSIQNLRFIHAEKHSSKHAKHTANVAAVVCHWQVSSPRFLVNQPAEPH